MTFETGRRGFLSLFGAAALAGPVEARPSGLFVPVRQPVATDDLIIENMHFRSISIRNCTIFRNDGGACFEMENVFMKSEGGVGMQFLGTLSNTIEGVVR